MQRGTIIKHRGSWTLRYRETQYRDGKPVKVRVAKKLARIGKGYSTKRSVRLLADAILLPLNQKTAQPESTRTVVEFIEKQYFPVIEHELRPSTVLNYRTSIFNKHLKHRLGKVTLREFRAVTGQKLMQDIRGVEHGTLLKIKNFLSGVFRFAKRQGVLDGLNPMQDVSVPGKPKKFEGIAYSIDEVERFLEEVAHDHNASDVIALLSFTGLRQSEARGLRWSDWNEKTERLTVSRGVWRVKVGPLKNTASEGIIPVLPLLKTLLEKRRDRVKPQPNDYIFAGTRRGAALDFHNLEARVIKPALKVEENEKKVKDWKWKSGIKWEGFHGFRRGLASILYELEVNPRVISAILRHSDMAMTLQFYIKTRESDSRGALARFEARIAKPSNVVIGGTPHLDPT